MKRFSQWIAIALLASSLAVAGCGSDGDDGNDGAPGEPGAPGNDGSNGNDGNDGSNGNDGSDGAPGAPGTPGEDAVILDPDTPLSSMVAVAFVDGRFADAPTSNVADYVKALVEEYKVDPNAVNAKLQFPLANAGTDTVRVIRGLQANTVVSWLDPLTFDGSADAPRFGSNSDYTAFFGDGYDFAAGPTAGQAPQYNLNTSDFAGYTWVNHEYISNSDPTTTSAPSGQHVTLATFLRLAGDLTNDILSDVWAQEDIDTYVEAYKKQLGGSWFRIVQDPGTLEWHVDLSSPAVRYDSTSNTQSLITGITLSEADQADDGTPLPTGVASGIAGDCSGATTPWGTVITAEENVQGYYGDLETGWSRQKFVPGAGYDGGANVTLSIDANGAGDYGRHSDPNQIHNRELYGYLTEIDVGMPADEFEGKNTAGVGHKKIGAMGRARWENATFVTGADWTLIADQPVVIYGGNDRRGGRIWKYVSSENYTAGMTKAQIRALLDDGSLYVAHFADLDNDTGFSINGGAKPTEAARGNGRWVEISTTSTDLAPNGTALGEAGKTVGEAILDLDYNRIGGFPDDNTARKALFTVAAKVGVRELNRPEDLEWNPLDPSGTPRLYIAFTNFQGQTQLDDDGLVWDPATYDETATARDDDFGSIFALEEANAADPGSSDTFTFWRVFTGTIADEDTVFRAANPDNLMIDADGGVWFGTDGNFGERGEADALYYLDLDTELPFRVVAGPSDSEATGPVLTPAMGTLFFQVQHPGERVFSTFPQDN